MANYVVEPFAQLNMDLRLRFNRLKRFQIKDKKQLIAGAYLNVRETLSLNNMMVVCVQVKGRPFRDKPEKGFTSLGFKVRVKKDSKWDSEEYFVSTLMDYNWCWNYNTETVQFFNDLIKEGRFMQHVILNEKPYSEETYLAFREEMLRTKSDDEASDKMIKSLINSQDSELEEVFSDPELECADLEEAFFAEEIRNKEPGVEEFIAILEKEGFQKVFEVKGAREQYRSETIDLPDEAHYLFAHKKGLLVSFNTFSTRTDKEEVKIQINNSQMNYQYRPENWSNFAWESGGALFPANLKDEVQVFREKGNGLHHPAEVWEGYHSGVHRNLSSLIQRMGSEGMFSSTWIPSSMPYGILFGYFEKCASDRSLEFRQEQHKVEAERFKALPQWVQDMTQCLYGYSKMRIQDLDLSQIQPLPV